MKKFLLLFYSLVVAANGFAQNLASNQDSSVKTTVLNFLKWYKDNEPMLHKIKMVNNYDGYDSTKFYSVNINGTEQYLTELKKSGYFPNKYIQAWRRYFKNADLNFKNHPQNDGPPARFDFEFILWTQEYDEMLSNLQLFKITVKERGKNKSKVFLEYPNVPGHLTYELTKQKGKWMIDSIVRWSK